MVVPSTETSTRDLPVVVVGGGLAGLAAAVELRSRGVERVVLIDKNAHAGGKMNVLTASSPKGEFSFDMGPTILTLPEVFRGIIDRSGRSSAVLASNLVELDLQWRCFYEDGVTIDLVRGVEAMQASLNRTLGGGAGDEYARFIGYSRRMMRLSRKVFFYRDLGGALDMMKSTPPNDVEILKDVLAMRMHSTVAGTVHKMIREPHVRQMVEHYLQYVGSSPFLAPAILCLIAAAQTDEGVWYTMGGTRCVARTLEKIAREQGVELILGKAVERILEKSGAAVGVKLEDGTEIRARAVVSNCDVQRTYRDLVASDPAKAEQKAIASKYTPACSGVVLYLGLDRQYEHLAHHNFMFSRDSRREFDDIYGRGVPAQDPTLYIAAPSRTDDSVAPKGCEALYILVHTAYRRGDQRWEGPGGLLEQYKPVILSKLKRFGMQDVEKHIIVDRWLSPDGIEGLYNAEGGAIYGLASHGRLSGGFKPRNRSRVLRDLYLCGGSSNPGPGVPMVLMSGVTAAWALAEDLGMGPAPEHPRGRSQSALGSSMREPKSPMHAGAGASR